MVVIDLDLHYCLSCQRYLDCSHTLLLPQQPQPLSDDDAGAASGAGDENREYFESIAKGLSHSGYCIIQSSLNTSYRHELFQTIQEFFSLPLHNKLQVISLDRARRGYSPLLTDNFASLTGQQKANDTVEKFRIGPLVEEMSQTVLQEEYYTSKEGRVHYFPNTWPSAIASGNSGGGSANGSNDSGSSSASASGGGGSPSTNASGNHSSSGASVGVAGDSDSSSSGGDVQQQSLFQMMVSRHYRSMEILSKRLLRFFEVAFHLPKGSLVSPMNQHTSIMGVNAYLPLDENQRNGLSYTTTDHVLERVAEHTDVSLFTMVWDWCGNSDILKLQMLQDGVWQDLHLQPNEYLVNIGECLQYWSENRLPPAVHRVVETMEGRLQSVSRYSIAFFASPRYDTPLVWPSCGNDDDIDDERENGETKTTATIDYSTWRKQKIKKTLQCIKLSQRGKG